jgi:hypothetical protein
MDIARRVFIGVPSDKYLNESEKEIKWGIVEKIEQIGYLAEMFGSVRLKPGLSTGRPWHIREVDRVARRCIGGVLIGLPRWRWPAEINVQSFPTEYNHYECAVLYTLGIPILVLMQDNIAEHCVFYRGSGHLITQFPENAGLKWLETADFTGAFGIWMKNLEKRRDVFLGYSSASIGLAANIKNILEHKFHATVLDWGSDFTAGPTILESITEAASRCSGGIFLFTRDEKMEGEENIAAPRDNVILRQDILLMLKVPIVY